MKITIDQKEAIINTYKDFFNQVKKQKPELYHEPSMETIMLLVYDIVSIKTLSQLIELLSEINQLVYGINYDIIESYEYFYGMSKYFRNKEKGMV